MQVVNLRYLHHLSFRCWLENIQGGDEGGGGISDFLESLDEKEVFFFSCLIFILVEPLQFV